MGSIDTRQFGDRDSLTLVEFLLARITEDEAVARAYLDREGASPSPLVRRVMERALDDCLARRRLVVEHAAAPHPDRVCTALKLLAAGHRDHPDHPGLQPA
ncbi:hypothetical protein GCM10009844_16300 [Nocardioides koreensis]|uniref:Uncharacterized protein n=1 Tax=Nocardioides koreensis TaxID=433651 RepID=A0ABN2ZKI0_9ACTN